MPVRWVQLKSSTTRPTYAGPGARNRLRVRELSTRVSRDTPPPPLGQNSLYVSVILIYWLLLIIGGRERGVGRDTHSNDTQRSQSAMPIILGLLGHSYVISIFGFDFWQYVIIVYNIHTYKGDTTIIGYDHNHGKIMILGLGVIATEKIVWLEWQGGRDLVWGYQQCMREEFTGSEKNIPLAGTGFSGFFRIKNS